MWEALQSFMQHMHVLLFKMMSNTPHKTSRRVFDIERISEYSMVRNGVMKIAIDLDDEDICGQRE